MESQTHSSSLAPVDADNPGVLNAEPPRGGSRRRLGLAIIVATALAMGAAIVVAVVDWVGP